MPASITPTDYPESIKLDKDLNNLNYNSKIDISVIIVNYNVKDFLLQCLRTINESRGNLSVEIIVIDNNSNDGSIDFLEPLFPDVLFIRSDVNLGFGKANNIGIEKAKGKYCLILNPDTLLSSDTLSHMYEFMETMGSEVGISGCKVLNGDGSFQLACRRGFPTPWASFSKLFGLQSLFPQSKIFGKYNQTYRSVDETYEIDAVIGAFMFGRTELLKQLGGFDTDFFMYGEDIDLCYRAKAAGSKVYYVHTTTIIHFKGESTKRSAIDEASHFYGAMSIFARKHYGRNSMFLKLLNLGIKFKYFLSSLSKYKSDLLLLIADIIIINATFLIATKIRFRGFFNLPDYAYPIVFFVITGVFIAVMIFTGAYFEGKNSQRRTAVSYLISFFILSSLTYFFKDYAFSRGMLLMTIGSSLLLSAFFRMFISIYEKYKGKDAERKVLIVGTNDKTVKLIDAISSYRNLRAEISGIVTIDETNLNEFMNFPILGNIEYINKIISENKIHQVIVSDERINANKLISIISENDNKRVRFHLANEFEELLTAKVIEEITGIDPTIPDYNINKPRIRFYKRLTDITFALFFLTIGFPFLELIFKGKKGFKKGMIDVLKGQKSLIGINRISVESNTYKPGLICMTDVSGGIGLSTNAIEAINDYYLRNVNPFLDADILIKFIFRAKDGK